MKKISAIAAVLIGMTASLAAQPRAVGIRTGATGFDVSYQHTLGGKNFIEAEAGVDFGYLSSGHPGFKATGTYNFLFARPAWTERGSWGLYAGPGISLGYVEDRVNYKQSSLDGRYLLDKGFMFAFTGQVGLEYTFWFPLQLSVDVRPYIGFHTSGGKDVTVAEQTVHYESKVGFYENGLMGFVPTISVRYRF